MSPENTRVNESWILTDCQQFVTNFFLAQKTDEPVSEMLRKVNCQIWAKLSRYVGYRSGLHLFANSIFDGNGVVRVELDYMVMDADAHGFIESSLTSRGLHGADVPEVAVAPTLYSYAEEDRVRATGLLKILRELCGRLKPARVEKSTTAKWRDLLKLLLSPIAATNGPKTNVETLRSAVDDGGKVMLLIPFSDPSDRLLTGHCGLFLFWDSAPIVTQRGGDPEGKVRFVVKLLAASLTRFYQIHYDAKNDTYLPGYRKIGQKKVAILFVDIRNFTPTTEVLRNFGRVDELMIFMREFCSELGEIVLKRGGRVVSYTGDGIMAAFGEYMSDDQLAVTSGIGAAREMYTKFQEIMERFLRSPRIVEFHRNEYETIDFGLGIGLTYGPVIFDYFGPPNNRVYTPLGDHVNFAQRLEANAGRFDSRLGRLRSPILCSRPAWNASGGDESWSRIEVEVKGKAATCIAFEVPVKA